MINEHIPLIFRLKAEGEVSNHFLEIRFKPYINYYSYQGEEKLGSLTSFQILNYFTKT